jgi:Ca2+-binding EF-hand superfamily protein|tara:strand:+ start:217 stop:369 length:153 start_codon:yes stop_codon:yes gene_type:complete
MTRKHFEQIASILKENKADPLLIREMASMCASNNQYFDYDRFYTACGITE